MCTSNHLLNGLESLRQCPNLEELDLDVGLGPEYTRSSAAAPASACAARALAGLRLKRLGLHASSGCQCLYIPEPSVPQVDRTFYISDEAVFSSYVTGETYRTTLEDQIDEGSRRRVGKLTLHVQRIPSCPYLSGFSALKELIVGDIWRDCSSPFCVPFILKGLEAVAGTLRHLSLSSSRAQTCVELPTALRLRSFMCVCSGTLLLRCDAPTLREGVVDVLMGYRPLLGRARGLLRNSYPVWERLCWRWRGSGV
jgi:hypothetical protein